MTAAMHSFRFSFSKAGPYASNSCTATPRLRSNSASCSTLQTEPPAVITFTTSFQFLCVLQQPRQGHTMPLVYSRQKGGLQTHIFKTRNASMSDPFTRENRRQRSHVERNCDDHKERIAKHHQPGSPLPPTMRRSELRCPKLFLQSGR